MRLLSDISFVSYIRVRTSLLDVNLTTIWTDARLRLDNIFGRVFCECVVNSSSWMDLVQSSTTSVYE